MPGGDWTVWQLFLDQRGTKWNEYAYDIELHGTLPPHQDALPEYTRAWSRVTAKRVDAIGFRAAGATLFEVRHNAAWQSLGQILGYRDLFKQDYPDITIESAAIVTDAIDPQIAAVAERQLINIIVLSTFAL